MEALERTHELLPDLMILDIMMPKMDAIKRLMADTSLLFIPVFLVTAKADGKDMIAGLEGGDDDTLQTPSITPRCRREFARCCGSRHGPIPSKRKVAGGTSDGARRVAQNPPGASHGAAR